MDLNKSGSQNETIFKRVEEISKLLCLSNRQVTDDALLNNLLTELNKYIIKCKKQSDLESKSAEFLKILREAFNNCENLKANNLAFLIEFFGNSIDYFEAPVCIESFLRLQESDIFEKEALIRSSWLSAYTGFIERFEEEISNEEAREFIQKLSNDISVFVSRQAQLTTIALLLRNKENQDEFEKIVNDCVFPSSDFLYSLLVNVKKMKSSGTKPVELCKKIYSLMSKEQKSARIVELYLDMHSIAASPCLSEDECFEITDEFFIKEHFRIHTLVASMQDDPNTALGGCLQRMLAILDDEEQPHVQFLDVLKKIDNYLSPECRLLVVNFYKNYFKNMPPVFNRKLQFMTIKIFVHFMAKNTSADFEKTLYSTLFEVLKNDRVSEKLKYPIYLAFGNLTNNNSVKEVCKYITDAYGAITIENWQLKDSILECFHEWSKKSFTYDENFIKKLEAILKDAVEDENPSVRTSGIRAYALFAEINKEKCPEILVQLLERTTSDMDFSTRRMGVLTVSRILKNIQSPFEHSEMKAIIHDTSPILEYKRQKINNLLSFISYMVRDDDWEVRKNIIGLICECKDRNEDSKIAAYLEEMLKLLIEDQVGIVSDAAKQALGIELSSRKEYSIERLEEILTDIELNLAVIHEEGKLEFSDNEMDNFADCY